MLSHVISQCLVTDGIPVKLQLQFTGSPLIPVLFTLKELSCITIVIIIIIIIIIIVVIVIIKMISISISVIISIISILVLVLVLVLVDHIL